MAWLLWLTTFLANLLEPLEGVRLLGQETGNFGGFDADVTAYERNGVPEILVRLHNATEKQAWWETHGAWRQADSWSVTYEHGIELGGAGGIVLIGCNGGEVWRNDITDPKPVRDYAPSSGQLQRWSVAPGEYRFFKPTFVHNPYWDDIDKVDVDLGKKLAWDVELDMPLPVWEKPKWERRIWVLMTFEVKIDSVAGGFALDLRGKD